LRENNWILINVSNLKEVIQKKTWTRKVKMKMPHLKEEVVTQVVLPMP